MFHQMWGAACATNMMRRLLILDWLFVDVWTGHFSIHGFGVVARFSSHYYHRIYRASVSTCEKPDQMCRASQSCGVWNGSRGKTRLASCWTQRKFRCVPPCPANNAPPVPGMFDAWWCKLRASVVTFGSIHSCRTPLIIHYAHKCFKLIPPFPSSTSAIA